MAAIKKGRGKGREGRRPIATTLAEIACDDLHEISIIFTIQIYCVLSDVRQLPALSRQCKLKALICTRKPVTLQCLPPQRHRRTLVSKTHNFLSQRVIFEACTKGDLESLFKCVAERIETEAWLIARLSLCFLPVIIFFNLGVRFPFPPDFCAMLSKYRPSISYLQRLRPSLQRSCTLDIHLPPRQQQILVRSICSGIHVNRAIRL